MRNFVLVFFGLTILWTVGCGKSDKSETTPQNMENQESKTMPTVQRPLSDADIQARIEEVKNLPSEPVADDEVAVIETTMGRIVFDFFPKVAPNHCANFKKLANAGYYDGTTFHRVIPGFMIQAGDILSADANPGNDGTGGPGYEIPAEFSNISHVRGIVSMARKGYSPNTAGSQFFIVVSDYPSLDGQYSVFGTVSEGMKVADKIVAVPRDARDRPYTDVVVLTVRVVKKGSGA